MPVFGPNFGLLKLEFLFCLSLNSVYLIFLFFCTSLFGGVRALAQCMHVYVLLDLAEDRMGAGYWNRRRIDYVTYQALKCRSRRSKCTVRLSTLTNFCHGYYSVCYYYWRSNRSCYWLVFLVAGMWIIFLISTNKRKIVTAIGLFPFKFLAILCWAEKNFQNLLSLKKWKIFRFFCFI